MVLKIGNIKLANPLVLAPMVDVTDCAYRKICRESGAAMAYTEMLYIDAILHDNDRTEKLMKKYRGEKPVGLQITGNSLGEFEKFVKSGKWKKFDLIDLNCGCPSMRITGNEAGSYLLNNPEKIAAIVKVLKLTKKPITVKVRLGFRKNNVLSVAREIERAGASALTVHGRLAVDGRDVSADWSWIHRVKRAVRIPVIGNGDVFCGADAERMLKICDGVMIARGAIGDPLIFSRIEKYLEKGKMIKLGKSVGGARGEKLEVGDDKIDAKENLKLFLNYIDLAEKYGVLDLGRVKYLGTKFLRGFKGAAVRRVELGRLKVFREIREFFGCVVLKK